jgi:hypothetical protein
MAVLGATQARTQDSEWCLDSSNFRLSAVPSFTFLWPDWPKRIIQVTLMKNKAKTFFPQTANKVLKCFIPLSKFLHVIWEMANSLSRIKWHHLSRIEGSILSTTKWLICNILDTKRHVGFHTCFLTSRQNCQAMQGTPTLHLPGSRIAHNSSLREGILAGKWVGEKGTNSINSKFPPTHRLPAGKWLNLSLFGIPWPLTFSFSLVLCSTWTCILLGASPFWC